MYIDTSELCDIYADQVDALWLINTSIFIEQFGYGFGFTAYNSTAKQTYNTHSSIY